MVHDQGVSWHDADDEDLPLYVLEEGDDRPPKPPKRTRRRRMRSPTPVPTPTAPRHRQREQLWRDPEPFPPPPWPDNSVRRRVDAPFIRCRSALFDLYATLVAAPATHHDDDALLRAGVGAGGGWLA